MELDRLGIVTPNLTCDHEPLRWRKRHVYGTFRSFMVGRIDRSILPTDKGAYGQNTKPTGKFLDHTGYYLVEFLDTTGLSSALTWHWIPKARS